MEKTENSCILIIEDDQNLATLTQEYLMSNGVHALIETSSANAINRTLKESPDLVVLDIDLPRENGISLCQRLRPHYGGYIIIMTSSTDELDEILGLEIGADDYITKPIKPRVLLARIRALLRRTNNYFEVKDPNQSTRLCFDNLTIDASIREAKLGDHSIDLTSAEFDLLWLLTNNAGEVLSREDIFTQLRGIEYNGQDRSIDVRVSRIRPKIGDNPLHPKLIKTVRNRGYLFVKHK